MKILILRTAAACMLTALASLSQASQTLDFEGARVLAHQNSDILRMATSETLKRTHETESLRSLHGPKVDIDFRQMWGHKDVDLGTKQIGPMSVPLNFSQDLYGPRLIGSVEMPIYMGGAINAKIHASEGGVQESRADEQARRDRLDAELAQKYFGVQLARSVEKLRRSMLSQQEAELQKAISFQKHGTISKVERLSVGVSRDEAAREMLAAKTDTRIAESEFMRLVKTESVGELTNPLFVVAGSLGDLQDWQTKAVGQSPALRSARAKKYQAEEGLKAAKAAWAPQVYAFARGNAIKHYLSITEPDWVAGIGVRFTLYSNKDRSASVAAARAVIDKADAGVSETVNQIEQAVETAYLRSCQTQEQYRLTLSTLELARENLRLRTRAFSEGLATATELDDARNKLLASEIARRVAAYRFVVSWAILNATCGTTHDFIASMSNPDNFIER